MTTVQESTNGHRVFPPPCSLPHPQEETQSKDSLNNNFNSTPASPATATEPFPANAYHVPPTRYAPKPHSYRYDDTLNLPPETSPLPERCQFMFSDGRQCTMGRSDIHPSLCPYHSEREDQLFGTPSSGGSVVGRAFDLPELYSACRDLTTASGVSRALGQVFRLLAQRRISRQEAATFGHLAQLLLRSISAARSESTDPARIGAPSEYHERGASPALLPNKKVAPLSDAHPDTKPPAKPEPSSRAAIRTEESQSLNEPPTPEESLPHITRPPHDIPSPGSRPESAPVAAKNPSGINTSATSISNPREINTSANAELKG